ncbi:MAG: hypothetical protein ACRCZF_23005, partial [Gemmataceae bacterium]
GMQLSLLLHPLDFLGADDVPCLGFFPAMSRGGAWTCDQMRSFFQILGSTFQVRPMLAEAERVLRERPRPLPRRAIRSHRSAV